MRRSFNKYTPQGAVMAFCAAALLMLVESACMEPMTIGGTAHAIDATRYVPRDDVRPGLGPLTGQDSSTQSFRFKLQGIDFLQPSDKYNLEPRFRIRWKIENKLTTAIWGISGMLVVLDEDGNERLRMMWRNDEILVPAGRRKGQTLLPYDKYNEDHVWLANRPRGSTFTWQWYELGVKYHVGLGVMPAFQWNESPDDVISREGEPDVRVLEVRKPDSRLVYKDRLMGGFLCSQRYHFYRKALRSVKVKLRNDEYVGTKQQVFDFIALRNNFSRIFGARGVETVNWVDLLPEEKMSGIASLLRRYASKVCFAWKNPFTRVSLCLTTGKKPKTLEAWVTFKPTGKYPLKINKKKRNRKKRRKPKKGK